MLRKNLKPSVLLVTAVFSSFIAVPVLADNITIYPPVYSNATSVPVPGYDGSNTSYTPSPPGTQAVLSSEQSIPAPQLPAVPANNTSTVASSAINNDFSQVLSNVPTYAHDDMIDNHPNSVTPLANDPPPRADRIDFGVGTKSGIDLAFQVSDYHYREPVADVSLTGWKAAADLLLIGKINPTYFVMGDIRFAGGLSDYSSWATVGNNEMNSGSATGNSEYLTDVRLLVGRDSNYEWYDFSPYLGIAYRNLSSDDRGITSLGASGYRRNNDLFYFPLGVIQRLSLSENNRLSATLEYDRLLLGVQKSHLSDIGDGEPDLDNVQRRGSGVRGEFMWERPHWGFGPFFDYWSIDESKYKIGCGELVCEGGFEPSNHTFEFGFQVRYAFFGN